MHYLEILILKQNFNYSFDLITFCIFLLKFYYVNVDFTESITGSTVSAKPSKIIAGLEVNKTLDLLITLAKAVDIKKVLYFGLILFQNCIYYIYKCKLGGHLIHRYLGNYLLGTYTCIRLFFKKYCFQTVHCNNQLLLRQ